MISLFLALALGWQDNPPPKVEPPKKIPTPTIISRQAPAKKTEALPGFAEIKKSYDQLMEQMSETYAEAKTPDENDAAINKNIEIRQKEVNPLAEKAMALARTQAADKKAATVLIWVLQAFPIDPQANEAADLMIKHHLQNPELYRAAWLFSSAPTDWSITVMKTLSDKAEAAEDRAKAKYYLAEMYHSLAEVPTMMRNLDEKELKRFEHWRGKANADRLKNVDSQAMNVQAEQLLEEIVAKHADVKMHSQTLGEMAKSYLFEIRNLSIGKPAPEITGEDIDGKPMKLSDYRGKVVVLDFWGYW